MDIKSILSLPKEHRRIFVWLLIAICIIIILCDIFLFPLASEPTKSGISAYARAIVGVILASLVMFWIIISFIPGAQFSAELDQVEPRKISSEFEKLFADALRWRYTGNFGRYLRGKVLPTLASRPNMQISVSIIDPNNLPLCEKHADYRNSINSIDKARRFDANVVALEVLVTIIHCAWFVANRNVSIELYLLSMYDPLRIDSSDNAMILTVEDRTRPALKITKSHFMYDHFDLKMQNERQQGKQLALSGFPQRNTISAIKESDIQCFLCDIGMEDLCNRLTAKAILQACHEARNPYDD